MQWQPLHECIHTSFFFALNFCPMFYFLDGIEFELWLKVSHFIVNNYRWAHYKLHSLYVFFAQYWHWLIIITLFCFFLSIIAYLSRAIIGLTIQWLNDEDEVQYNKEIIRSFIELSICNVKNRSIVCHNILQWAFFCLMHFLGRKTLFKSLNRFIGSLTSFLIAWRINTIVWSITWDSLFMNNWS